MPFTPNTIIPIGNNLAANAGLPKFSDSQKANYCSNIIKNSNIYYGNWRKEIIDVRSIEIDMSYQRMHHKYLKSLIQRFDKDRMPSLQISFRDNKFYVYDGQHRLMAAIANGIYEVPCEIHVGLTKEDEAERFSKQTECSAKLSTYDTYKANIQWGEPIDMMLKELCEKYSLVVRKAQKDGIYVLSAIGTAREILRNPDCGYECLDWALGIFHVTKWTVERNVCVDDFLRAMKEVYKDAIRDNNIDQRTENLINVFKKFRPQQIRDFAGVAINKGRRRNAVECFKEISLGHWTENDIQAYNFCNL